MTAVGCDTVEVNPPQHSIKQREKCGLGITSAHGREADGCSKTFRGAVGNILQHNYPPEAVNAAFYDREAQSGTIFSRSAAAEERLEYPIDVAGRAAWSGIFDLHHRFVALAIDPDIDASALRRKA